MAVALAATLVGSSDPKPVLLTLSGMTSGDEWHITATAGAVEWEIPGASGVSDGSSVLVTDRRSPLRTAITYTAVVNGAATATATATVACDRDGVLSTLDGSQIAYADIAATDMPRKGSPRVALVGVSGRRRPIAYRDIATSDEITWPFLTTGTDTLALRTLLESGRPLVLRTPSGYADFPGTAIVQPTEWDSVLADTYSIDRIWSLTLTEVDDPEPSRILVAFTWDDIDALDLTWDDIDALALTWDQAEAFDWSTL